MKNHLLLNMCVNIQPVKYAWKFPHCHQYESCWWIKIRNTNPNLVFLLYSNSNIHWNFSWLIYCKISLFVPWNLVKLFNCTQWSTVRLRNVRWSNKVIKKRIMLSDGLFEDINYGKTVGSGYLVVSGKYVSPHRTAYRTLDESDIWKK